MAGSEIFTTDVIYERENWIDVTENKDGGILKKILKSGTGDETPSPGDKVNVNYVGMLENGTEFDSSRSREKEFKFDIGRGNDDEHVVHGMDLGIATMKKGEVARFKIRPEYGRGRAGLPPKIPGDAVLIYEVELIDWHGEDLTDTEDGGIIRHIIEKARAWDSPNEGATVEIHIIGKHNNHVFEDRDVRFVMGEGVDQKLLPAVENSLKRFRRNEKSRLVIQPKYGYGETGNKDLDIPPNAELTYIVHLKSFEKAKDNWELDDNEKVEQAYIFKDKGTRYLKKSSYCWVTMLVFFICLYETFKPTDLANRMKLLILFYEYSDRIVFHCHKYTTLKGRCEEEKNNKISVIIQYHTENTSERQDALMLWWDLKKNPQEKPKKQQAFCLVLLKFNLPLFRNPSPPPEHLSRQYSLGPEDVDING
ncbi:hypothetical protein ACJMK2_020617 [Sinanodonta woodiana]|uniref:peptidylprolyl isomerase n=1 Tax=Sinanodonta woodiana TaxID=1069815 RepID=A0ABD3TZM0_SINWO